VRTFLALDLAPPLAQAAGAWADALADHLGSASARGLRWTAAAQRHVTLHFLGDVPAPRVSALADRLSSGLPLAPFTATLASAGLFPPRGPARIVWLGLRSEADVLSLLHAAVATHLRALALPLDERPFHPHVTIARVRDDADRRLGRRLREWCAATPPQPAAAPVARVTCYESRPSPNGSTYRALFQVPLAGP
jgi:2'-5' RNA ligase